MMHEYCVNGHPKEKVIFVLAVISIASASFISTFFSNIQQFFHIIIATSISEFTLFTVLFFSFNKILWRIKFFGTLFKFPDFNGEWECTGISYSVDTKEKMEWAGTIKINQTWDKILITLTTENSTSHSLSFTSGVKYIYGLGYKLSYHYENVPKTSETELNKHEGSCSLTFNEDISSAAGSYFNNIRERKTYGEIALTRRIK